MLFTTNTITENDYKKVENFFEEFENNSNKTSEVQEMQTSVCKYINSLVTNCYKKSVNDIAKTSVGNKLVRRRNFQQVMQESFFYGANRFGNNFIA